ncbi:MAG: hypothetical protein WAW23_04310 [Candidatus Methanoperedens sp.]
MSILSKTLYIIIFVIAIILSVIYLIGLNEVEAAKVTVEITKVAPYKTARFNDTEVAELIGNISLDKIYVKKLTEPQGNNMVMPGISVGLFRNNLMVSDWTSVAIHDRGVYELTVGLRQPLKKGDVIRIAVYVNDDKGKVIIGKRRDVVWD